MENKSPLIIGADRSIVIPTPLKSVTVPSVHTSGPVVAESVTWWILRHLRSRHTEEIDLRACVSSGLVKGYGRSRLIP